MKQNKHKVNDLSVQVLNIYKPQDVTPFQLIQRFRVENPMYKDIKIGFAGRLDPLAHGVMVLLMGGENKNREQYLGMEKEYEFEVFLGVETDSYDYLGLLKSDEYKSPPKDLDLEIEQFIQDYTGKLTLPYPPFSSKTINGVPLYKLAKKNKLSETDLPMREIEIKQFELLKVDLRTSEEIYKEILANLRKIKGFFRQGKIIAGWKEFFNKYSEQEFILARFKIECSSGTYVRTLAHLMGEKLGCGAIAFEILRTRVGKYYVEDSIRLENNF